MEKWGYLAAAVVAIAMLKLVWGVVNSLWVKPRQLERSLRKQGFHGRSYRSLFGDVMEEIQLLNEATSKPINFSNDIVTRILPLHHRLMVEAQGKRFFTWIGTKPRVNIADPEQIKTIFSNINEFEKPDFDPITALIAVGTVTHNGAKWAKHRKIIQPAFHSEKLKIMQPAFYQSCYDMVTEWEKLISGADNGCELDVWPSLQNLSRDVISRTAFGSSYKEGERIFNLQNYLAYLIGQSMYSSFIPGWRFLPTNLNKKIRQTDSEMKDLIIDLIKKRENAMNAGEQIENDVLSILIESNSREIKEQGNDARLGMSMQDVIDECKMFYLAGQETTSSLLVWTIVLLSVHQEWQAKAREEVLKVFGHGNPHFDGLNQLKIVTMILYEVLRLYPSIAILNRKVTKETRVGNVWLPSGILITLPTLMIHHDSELWGDDAEDFKPERFSEGIFKATNGQTIFFPFGSGPRTCFGQNFAMIESKMAFSMILQRFSFVISPSYAHAPRIRISIQPQHGAHIILKKL